MFSHAVYFWIAPGTPPAAVEQLAADCREILTKIPTVRHLWAGRPVASERPVVDGSYAVGLTVIFDDKAGHDVYAEHPLHLQFIARNKAHWQRVQVYDFA